jgi:hypothetical protein
MEWFSFAAELYQWDARNDASWVFVSLPEDISDEVADLAPTNRGFGSVRVIVRCGDDEWATSVFPDSTSGVFVLPVKKAIRVSNRIEIGDTAEFDLQVVVE